MKLDHLLIVVADLHAAVAEFESRYGLASVAGGRHTGWGTANRIVLLGRRPSWPPEGGRHRHFNDWWPARRWRESGLTASNAPTR